METIESLIADTILENPITVKVGKRTYKVAPPTVATLIEASKYIALLPELPTTEVQDKDVIGFSLAYARDTAVLSDLTAVLMLGCKVAQEPIKITADAKSWRNNRFFRLFGKKKAEVFITRREQLAEVLLNTLSSKDLLNLLTQLISRQEVGFFFNTITFLGTANLLRKTKTTEATASGQ